MNLLSDLHSPATVVAPSLRTALIRTSESWQPRLPDLSTPERFRASGALQSWCEVFESLPSTTSVRLSLASAAVAPRAAHYEMMMAIERHIALPADEQRALAPALHALVGVACDLLSFCLRDGAVRGVGAAPAPPRDATDAATAADRRYRDTPIRALSLPARPLCVVPPAAGTDIDIAVDIAPVMVFAQSRSSQQPPAALALVALKGPSDAPASEHLTLSLADAGGTIAGAIDDALDLARRRAANAHASGAPGFRSGFTDADWRRRLELVLPLLCDAPPESRRSSHNASAATAARAPQALQARR